MEFWLTRHIWRFCLRHQLTPPYACGVLAYATHLEVLLTTPAYATLRVWSFGLRDTFGGFAYDTSLRHLTRVEFFFRAGRSDMTLTKHVHGGFGRCSGVLASLQDFPSGWPPKSNQPWCLPTKMVCLLFSDGCEIHFAPLENHGTFRNHKFGGVNWISPLYPQKSLPWTKKHYPLPAALSLTCTAQRKACVNEDINSAIELVVWLEVGGGLLIYPQQDKAIHNHNQGIA